MEPKLNQQRINGLTDVPVQVECNWVAKLSATRPPDYLPRTEYTLRCQLAAPEPFFLVWLVGEAHTTTYLRGMWDDAAVGFELILLQLEDWEHGQPLALGFGGAGIGIERPAELHTGILYDWAVDAAPEHSTRQVLLLAQRDVECVRSQWWRLRRDLWAGLPSSLAFLKRARASGTIHGRSLG